MSYKNIKSMLHNFAHSFVSLMNHTDGEYAIDIISLMLNKSHMNELTIHFPSGKIEPKSTDNKRLKILEKSIGNYNSWLQEHAKNHGVELEIIHDIKIIARKTRFRIEYHIQAIDNRDVKYNIPVRNTL